MLNELDLSYKLSKFEWQNVTVRKTRYIKVKQ